MHQNILFIFCLSVARWFSFSHTTTGCDRFNYTCNTAYIQQYILQLWWRGRYSYTSKLRFTDVEEITHVRKIITILMNEEVCEALKK